MPRGPNGEDGERGEQTFHPTGWASTDRQLRGLHSTRGVLVAPALLCDRNFGGT